MTCLKCGSDNVSINAVSITKTKHHGFLWWLFIGWWWVPFKWLFFFLPALIIKLIRSKRTESIIKSEAVCQTCGYHWPV
jgi:cellulose synthase/poly-beta-1,6-N-acetylglucosamine synthase-like glycosyltransferase